MALVFDALRESYRMQRAASQGAGITLVAAAGEYRARFDCAKRVAQILGERGLKDLCDGILESAPVYYIPVEEMQAALAKLSARYSVALVDLVCEKHGNRFVTVYKIDAQGNPAAAADPAPEAAPKVYTVEDF